MSKSLSLLIAELQPWAHKLVNVASTAGVGGRVTSTKRTFAEQSQLYSIWQAGKSPYPVAVPGTSAHEYGYAFDYSAPSATDQSDLGQVWEQWGGVWGGRYGDPVHFEYPGFKGQASSPRTSAQCSPTTSFLAQAVDFVLGFAPGIGEVELVAWLVSFGFPKSQVLKFLQNPVSSAICPPPK